MRRALLVLALLITIAAPAAAVYDRGDLKTLYVLSPDAVFEEYAGKASARLPAGPSAVPSGPIMHGLGLPAEVAPWLAELAPEDRAVLYFLHGQRGLSLDRFPVDELAALTNASDCGFLMIVLDLPCAPAAPAIESLARERRRIEAFDRHTLIVTAKPWDVRYWTSVPTGATGLWWEQHEAGASLFGAYLFLALQGLGDRNFDGTVTAREAFNYAFWCTWVDCRPVGTSLHGSPRRQLASVRPGAGWDEVVLSTGTYSSGTWPYSGWPDPLSIIAAHYTTLHFVPPPGPLGPAGPARQRGEVDVGQHGECGAAADTSGGAACRCGGTRHRPANAPGSAALGARAAHADGARDRQKRSAGHAGTASGGPSARVGHGTPRGAGHRPADGRGAGERAGAAGPRTHRTRRGV